MVFGYREVFRPLEIRLGNRFPAHLLCLPSVACGRRAHHRRKGEDLKVTTWLPSRRSPGASALASRTAAFAVVLRSKGYIEGQNVTDYSGHSAPLQTTRGILPRYRSMPE